MAFLRGSPRFKGLYILTVLTTAFAQSCYKPNGNPPDNFYVPCAFGIGHDGFQTCCKSQSPFTATCLSNGMCFQNVTDPSLGLSEGYYRGACTDRSGKSSSCVQMCNVDTQGHLANSTSEAVTKCDDGSWCCGTENRTVSDVAYQCCQAGNGFLIANDGNVTLANATTASTSHPPPTALGSSSGLTSSTNAPLPTPTPTPTPSNNVGAIAGGTVGGVAALAIATAIIVLCIRRSRKRKSEVANEPVSSWNHTNSEPFQTPGGKQILYEVNGEQVHEKDGVGDTLMESHGRLQELPS